MQLGQLWACYVANDDPEDELLILLTPPTTIPSSCCIGYQTQSNVPAGQELYQLICLLRQTLLFLISVFIQLIINLLLPTRSGLTKALVTTGPTNAYIPQEVLYTFWICEPQIKQLSTTPYKRGMAYNCPLSLTGGRQAITGLSKPPVSTTWPSQPLRTLCGCSWRSRLFQPGSHNKQVGIFCRVSSIRKDKKL